MHQIEVIRLNSYAITCGMCGKLDNQANPKDRQCVPFLNGSPTISNSSCDGYWAVCKTCYNKWSAWDDKVQVGVATSKEGGK